MKIKDCFGNPKYIYLLPAAIDESFVDFLKQFGPVRVFRDFTFPMIQMNVKEGFRLSGVFGDKKCTVVFKQKEKKELFDERLKSFFSP